MKETILEEAVRSVLQLIGADSVTLKIVGTVDAYYGLATWTRSACGAGRDEHSPSLEALETAMRELNGIGFYAPTYAPTEIRFKIDRLAFWREVDQWLESIGVIGGELIDDRQCEILGKTIGELAKARAWKRLIAG